MGRGRLSTVPVIVLTLLLSGAAGTRAQPEDPPRPDPRSLILTLGEGSETLLPPEGIFVGTAADVWLPCDVTIDAASPFIFVTLPESGFGFQQAVGALEDADDAAFVMASIRVSLARLASGGTCRGPESVLTFEITDQQAPPTGAWDEAVRVVGVATIAAEQGPTDGAMALDILRHGPLITYLMVRAPDAVGIDRARVIQTQMLDALAALIDQTVSLPPPQAVVDWTVASAETSNRVADSIEAFGTAFQEAGSDTRRTRRAANRFRSATERHLEWLRDNPLPPLSARFTEYFRELDSAVRRLATCPNARRCNAIISTDWEEANLLGNAASRLRDLASIPFEVADAPVAAVEEAEASDADAGTTGSDPTEAGPGEIEADPAEAEPGESEADPGESEDGESEADAGESEADAGESEADAGGEDPAE